MQQQQQQQRVWVARLAAADAAAAVDAVTMATATATRTRRRTPASVVVVLDDPTATVVGATWEGWPSSLAEGEKGSAPRGPRGGEAGDALPTFATMRASSAPALEPPLTTKPTKPKRGAALDLDVSDDAMRRSRMEDLGLPSASAFAQRSVSALETPAAARALCAVDVKPDAIRVTRTPLGVSVSIPVPPSTSTPVGNNDAFKPTTSAARAPFPTLRIDITTQQTPTAAGVPVKLPPLSALVAAAASDATIAIVQTQTPSPDKLIHAAVAHVLETHVRRTSRDAPLPLAAPPTLLNDLTLLCDALRPSPSDFLVALLAGAARATHASIAPAPAQAALVGIVLAAMLKTHFLTTGAEPGKLPANLLSALSLEMPVALEARKWVADVDAGTAKHLPALMAKRAALEGLTRLVPRLLDQTVPLVLDAARASFWLAHVFGVDVATRLAAHVRPTPVPPDCPVQRADLAAAFGDNIATGPPAVAARVKVLRDEFLATRNRASSEAAHDDDADDDELPTALRDASVALADLEAHLAALHADVHDALRDEAHAVAAYARLGFDFAVGSDGTVSFGADNNAPLLAMQTHWNLPTSVAVSGLVAISRDDDLADNDRDAALFSLVLLGRDTRTPTNAPLSLYGMTPRQRAAPTPESTPPELAREHTFALFPALAVGVGGGVGGGGGGDDDDKDALVAIAQAYPPTRSILLAKTLRPSDLFQHRNEVQRVQWRAATATQSKPDFVPSSVSTALSCDPTAAMAVAETPRAWVVSDNAMARLALYPPNTPVPSGTPHPMNHVTFTPSSMQDAFAGPVRSLCPTPAGNVVALSYPRASSSSVAREIHVLWWSPSTTGVTPETTRVSLFSPRLASGNVTCAVPDFVVPPAASASASAATDVDDDEFLPDDSILVFVGTLSAALVTRTRGTGDGDYAVDQTLTDALTDVLTEGWRSVGPSGARIAAGAPIAVPHVHLFAHALVGSDGRMGVLLTPGAMARARASVAARRAQLLATVARETQVAYDVAYGFVSFASQLARERLNASVRPRVVAFTRELVAALQASSTTLGHSQQQQPPLLMFCPTLEAAFELWRAGLRNDPARFAEFVAAYEWPDMFRAEDVEALTRMLLPGGALTAEALADMLPRPNLNLTLEELKRPLAAALRASRFDAKDVLRLVVSRYAVKLARKDLGPNALQGPSLAVLASALRWWDAQGAEKWGVPGPPGPGAATSGVTPHDEALALRWACVANLRVLTRQRLGASLRALAMAVTPPKGESGELPRPLLRVLTDAVSESGADATTSTAFTNALRSLLLERAGMMSVTVWVNCKDDLGFYARAAVPSAAPDVDGVLIPMRSLVLDPLQGPWAVPPPPTSETDPESSTPPLPSALFRLRGFFEASASGHWIFSVRDEGVGNAVRYVSWIQAGAHAAKIVHRDAPVAFELAEGDRHTFEALVFARPGNRLVLRVEGPMDANNARERLQQGGGAAPLPGTLAAARGLWATLARPVDLRADETCSESARFVVSSVAANMTLSFLERARRKEEEEEEAKRTRKGARGGGGVADALVTASNPMTGVDATAASTLTLPCLWDASRFRAIPRLADELLDTGAEAWELLLRAFPAATRSGVAMDEAHRAPFFAALGRAERAFEAVVDAASRGELSVAAVERLYAVRESVVAALDAPDTNALLESLHEELFRALSALERLDAVMGAFSDSSASAQTTLPVAGTTRTDTADDGAQVDTVNAVLRAFKRQRVAFVRSFLREKLPVEIRPSGDLVEFLERHAKNALFQRVWGLHAPSGTAATTGAFSEASEFRRRGVAARTEWDDLGKALLSGDASWSWLERVQLHTVSPEEVERDLKQLLAAGAGAPDVERVTADVQLWRRLYWIAVRHEDASVALANLRPLLASGADEDAFVKADDALRSCAADASLATPETRAKLSLREAMDVAARTAASAVDPTLVELDPGFCAAVSTSLPLLQWLRKFAANDAEFSSALEMLFTRSELEVPAELWSHENNSVDVTILSALSDVRAKLGALIFAPALPAALLSSLLGNALAKVAVGRTSSVGYPATTELICEQLARCTRYRRAIMELFSTDQDGKASKSRLVYLRTRHARFVVSDAHAVVLEYTVPGLAEPKTLGSDELADLQATLLLGEAEHVDENNPSDQDVDYLAELTTSFVEELGLCEALHASFRRLAQAGHVSFFGAQVEVPFASPSGLEALRRAARVAEDLGEEWDAVVASVRNSFRVVNAWTPAQLVVWTRLLVVMESGGGSPGTHAQTATAWDVLGLTRRDGGGETTRAGAPGNDVLEDPEREARQLWAMRDASLGGLAVAPTLEETRAAFAGVLRSGSPSGQTLNAKDVLVAVATALSSVARPLTPRLVSDEERAKVPISDALANVEPGGVRVSRVPSAALVDSLVAAFVARGRLPTREDALVCGPWTCAAAVENLVRRWAAWAPVEAADAEDEGHPRLFALGVPLNALSYETQVRVATQIKRAMARRTARAPLLLVFAGGDVGAAGAKGIVTHLETSFAGSGRVVLPSVSVATLRDAVRSGLGVEGAVFTSRVAGAGKTFAVNSFARPGPLPLRLRLNDASADAIALLVGLSRRFGGGGAPSPQAAACLHIDVSDTAAREASLDPLLFELVFLGGVADDATGLSWSWSTLGVRKLAVELPSGVSACAKHARAALLLTRYDVALSAASFQASLDGLVAGMGEAVFSSTRFDGTVFADLLVGLGGRGRRSEDRDDV